MIGLNFGMKADGNIFYIIHSDCVDCGLRLESASDALREASEQSTSRRERTGKHRTPGPVAVLNLDYEMVYNAPQRCYHNAALPYMVRRCRHNRESRGHRNRESRCRRNR
ncbi:hypothetical protein LSAT2_012221 [Lamellibrachia satsuma]|nr:hypothetical protein LSAT2_012221 [Lamellibrachia satsuma]